MSDLFFKCPGCAQDIEAPDDLAGTMINCPGCDQLLRVPGEPRIRGEFIFLCPACGQSIDVPADASGVHLPCPGCGATINVPEPPPPPVPGPDPSPFSSDPGAVEAEKKGATSKIDLPLGDSVPPPQMRTVLIKRSRGVQKGEIPRVPASPEDSDVSASPRKGGLFGWMKR